MDVSHYQSSINWPTVYSPGGEAFALIKATQGTSYSDSSFTTNISQATAAGVIAGAYHFANPDADSTLAADPSNTTELAADAVAEANYFYSVAGSYLTSGHLQPALDIEADGGNGGFNNNFTPQEIATWANDWITQLQTDIAGVRPILYMNQTYAENFGGVSSALKASLTQYPLWISALNNNPSFVPKAGPWGTWAIMQYSQTGTVAGITGNVDVDVLNPGVSLYSLEIGAAPPQSVQNVLQAYDAGASAFTNSVCSTVANQGGLGQNIPLLGESLGAALGITGDIEKPFQTQPTANTPNVMASGLDIASSGVQPLDQTSTTWDSVVSTFQNAGFTILIGAVDSNGNLVEDASGNLLEVSRTYTLTAPASLIASGTTGFDYLDSATGSLLGAISVQSPSIAFQVTLGVDIQNGQPSFFVADSTGLQLNNLTASGTLSGSLAIGSLGNVDASVTPSLTINTASLGLTSIEGDHKIRTGDVTSNLSQVVTGNVQGTMTLGANLTAHMSMLPDISWSPSFTAMIDNSGFHQGSFNLNPPDAGSLLSSLAKKFFPLGSGIPILGPLSSVINQPLPLINESIAQLTGLEGKLPDLPDVTTGLDPSSILNTLSSYGIVVNGGDTSMDVNDPNGLPAMVNKLIHGQHVDLISWSKANPDLNLLNDSWTIPIFSLGVPDVASVELDALFSIRADLSYDVGMGIDTNGFWIKAGSLQNDPTIGLTFSANAGLEGQVEVFGFPLASASGTIGFGPALSVAITAPPYTATPGRVYMSDLAMFGSNPFNDFLDALSVDIGADLYLHAEASINLFLFSIGWSWDKNFPIFNYVHNAPWPAAPGTPGSTNDPYPAGPDANGVLTFNGSTSADNVQLKQIGPGQIQLTWANHGPTHTYSNVSEVVFHGNGGSDRLTTASGFTIPIQADSGDSSGDKSFLQGGDGGNTLVAGSGDDTLVGGKGNDSLTGGAGKDILIGNDGNDTLTAGSGDTQIFGGSGNSTLIGGSGNDSIYAGGGNDVIHGGSGVYFIDGGSGNNVIYGDAGHAAETINAVLTYPIIHGGSGSDIIYGGTAPTQIFGDGGSDTIYGGPGSDTIHAGNGGNNLIHGGGGNDLIFGGGGGDILCGDSGNATIYGGPGNRDPLWRRRDRLAPDRPPARSRPTMTRQRAYRAPHLFGQQSADRRLRQRRDLRRQQRAQHAAGRAATTLCMPARAATIWRPAPAWMPCMAAPATTACSWPSVRSTSSRTRSSAGRGWTLWCSRVAPWAGLWPPPSPTTGPRRSASHLGRSIASSPLAARPL